MINSDESNVASSCIRSCLSSVNNTKITPKIIPIAVNITIVTYLIFSVWLLISIGKTNLENYCEDDADIARGYLSTVGAIALSYSLLASALVYSIMKIIKESIYECFIEPSELSYESNLGDKILFHSLNLSKYIIPVFECIVMPLVSTGLIYMGTQHIWYSTPTSLHDDDHACHKINSEFHSNARMGGIELGGGGFLAIYGSITLAELTIRYVRWCLCMSDSNRGNRNSIFSGRSEDTELRPVTNTNKEYFTFLGIK